jgi:hypothetical protein
MTAELLDQPEAVAAAERIFGGLLHPRPSHGPAGFPPTRHRWQMTRDTTR